MSENWTAGEATERTRRARAEVENGTATLLLRLWCGECRSSARDRVKLASVYLTSEKRLLLVGENRRVRLDVVGSFTYEEEDGSEIFELIESGKLGSDPVAVLIDYMPTVPTEVLTATCRQHGEVMLPDRATIVKSVSYNGDVADINI